MTISQRAKALRDFFCSVHSDEMQSAVNVLQAATTDPAPRVMNWGKVEIDFNKLFVSPAIPYTPPLAPPIASVYLDSEPLLMGKSTLTIRNIYQLLGLACLDDNSLPDDHVSLELDACLMMQAILGACADDNLQALWLYFINDHMGQWIPAFVARIREAPDVHPVFSYVAYHLEHWVDDARKRRPPFS